MKSSSLQSIEKELPMLSQDEQLWLIERVAQHLRYLGPKGAPGIPEMLAPTSALIGQGLGETVGLITDGRFSGGTWGIGV